jgi:hypothetical protein
MPGRQLVGQTVYGNAASFNGSNQFFDCTLISSVTDNFTLSLMVKLNANNVDQVLFANGKHDGDGFYVYGASDATLRLRINQVFDFNSTQSLTTNTWYHLVLRRQSGTWQFFVDGSAIVSTASNTPNTPTAFTAVGCRKNSASATSMFLNGLLDEVRFYERALSDDEIAALYSHMGNINLPDIDGTSLKAWWKLDESSGQPQDSSGNSHTLTSNNDVPFVQGIVAISDVPARTAAGVRTLAGTRTLAT